MQVPSSQSFSLYIHLPYCAYKCPYCDFNAYAVTKVPEPEYAHALQQELRTYSRDPRFIDREIETIYFGGGTPSLFSPESLSGIIDCARSLFPGRAKEITVEANPGSVTGESLSKLRSAGVTRLSIGAQSGNPKHLKTLGRKHTKDDVEQAVRNAIEAGFDNLTVDLIFAAPDQTLEDLKADLEWLISLDTQHVSIYGLTIEPGTPLFQSVERGIVRAVDSDLQADMYELIVRKLTNAGFQHYEISNFAKPGYLSLHNSAYWEGKDYLGIGAGAHSYVCSYENGKRVSGERWSARANPDEYMKLALSGGSARAWSETLGTEKLMQEFFYLGLRKIKGVSLEVFETLFTPEARAKFEKILRELSKKELVAITENAAALSSKGLLLSDSVFQEILL